MGYTLDPSLTKSPFSKTATNTVSHISDFRLLLNEIINLQKGDALVLKQLFDIRPNSFMDEALAA